MHRKSYVFLFQVKEVVDGFIHKLRATCDSHKVRVCSSTLGKPEINLKKDGAMSRTGYFKVMKHKKRVRPSGAPRGRPGQSRSGFFFL